MYSARKEKDIKLCFLSSGKPMVQQQFPEFFGVLLYVQDWARLGGVIIFTQVYFSSKLLCTTHTAAQYFAQWVLSLHTVAYNISNYICLPEQPYPRQV